MRRDRRPHALILSQVYVPDPAAVGQHLADLASALDARGLAVDVLTADRGYDDPRVSYPRSELINGAQIHRLQFSSFGKRSLAVRAVGGILFSVSAAIRGMFLRSVDVVVVTTVPPAGVLAALWIAKVRRAALVYWVMDLNPDQAVSLGLATNDSLMSRALHWLNKSAFREADILVVLDDFMERRVRENYGVQRPILVVPPWSHNQFSEPAPRTANRFRSENGVRDDQVLFMYSGNHAQSAPVTTLLQAAKLMREDDRAVFFFVGGGQGKPAVEAFVDRHSLGNVRCLPYQLLEDLGELLAAADVHMVTMGEHLVGINHPCKVYGAMAVGRPILYVGPSPSHVSVLIDECDIGWHIDHGDFSGILEAVNSIVGDSTSNLNAKGRRAQRIANSRFRKDLLLSRLADAIEELL